ncbi:hypothetical protein HK096_009742, partial [Nowakowskiella sp. JEL0078]
MAKSLFTGVESLPNITFVTGNILDGLPYPDNHFDVVYQRSLMWGIPKCKWDDVILELKRITKPGGFIELVEQDSKYQNLGPKTSNMINGVLQAGSCRGVDLEIAHKLKSKMKMADFQIECENISTLPIGWGGDIGELHKANMNMFFMSMKPFMTKSFQMTGVEYGEMVDEVIMEYPVYKTYHNNINTSEMRRIRIQPVIWFKRLCLVMSHNPIEDLLGLEFEAPAASSHASPPSLASQNNFADFANFVSPNGNAYQQQEIHTDVSFPQNKVLKDLNTSSAQPSKPEDFVSVLSAKSLPNRRGSSQKQFLSKSQKIATIQNVFSESQKLAYSGLCYLGVIQYKKQRLNPIFSSGGNGKRVIEAYDKWAKAFFTKLFVYLEVTEDEQQMLHQLSEHGIVPSDLSSTLIEDAQKSAEELKKSQAAKLQKIQTSLDRGEPPPEEDLLEDIESPSDIRYTVLSHLFIMCISDGVLDSRSRTLLKQVSNYLQVPWLDVLQIERAIAEQLRIAETAGQLKKNVAVVGTRNRIEGRRRWLYMGLATLAGGAVIGLTAGLAAPFIGAGIGAALTTVGISAGAGITGTLTSTAGIAIITSTGVLTGGGMGGFKMLKRTRGITEFEFLSISDGIKKINESKERRRKQREKKRKSKIKKLSQIEAKSQTPTDQKHSVVITATNVAPSPLEPESSSQPYTSDLLFDAEDDFRDFQDQSKDTKSSESVKTKHQSSLIIELDNEDAMTNNDFDDTYNPQEPSSFDPWHLSNSTPNPEAKVEENIINITHEEETSPVNTSVLITIAGWITYGFNDFTLPFSTLEQGIYGEQYTLMWESPALQALGSTLTIIVSEMASFLVQQGIQAFALPMLMAALTGPLWALKLSYLIDNPWGNGLSKAKKAGKVLADTLMNQVQENRPVTLIGYSLGARVIYFCLAELAAHGAFGIVEEAYIFGCPIMATKAEWCAIASVVSGRVVNGYLTKDYVLGVLYRASSALWNEVAGLRPVMNIPGIENINLDGIIQGHLDYRMGMPRILLECGFTVTQDYFEDEEEEEARERIEELEIRKKEREERIKKRREELENKRKEDERKKASRMSNSGASDTRRSSNASTTMSSATTVNDDSTQLWMELLNETKNIEEAKKLMELFMQPKELQSTMPTLVLGHEETKPSTFDQSDSYSQSISVTKSMHNDMSDPSNPTEMQGAGDIADCHDDDDDDNYDPSTIQPESLVSNIGEILSDDVFPTPARVAAAAAAVRAHQKTGSPDVLPHNSTGFADYFANSTESLNSTAIDDWRTDAEKAHFAVNLQNTATDITNEAVINPLKEMSIEKKHELAEVWTDLEVQNTMSIGLEPSDSDVTMPKVMEAKKTEVVEQWNDFHNDNAKDQTKILHKEMKNEIWGNYHDFIENKNQETQILEKVKEVEKWSTISDPTYNKESISTIDIDVDNNNEIKTSNAMFIG